MRIITHNEYQQKKLKILLLVKLNFPSNGVHTVDKFSHGNR